MIGIYKLVFKGTNKVYIGQSRDITSRYYSHLSTLSSNKGAKKLQQAYNMYGKPSIEVLCECSLLELDTYENETIEIYDAVNNGFNSACTAGSYATLPGELNGFSKYSNSDIVKVFLLLVEGATSTNIQKITGVNAHTVQAISCCHRHKWLAEMFPEQYQIFLDRKGRCAQAEVLSAKARGIIYPSIFSPEGEEYTVDNLNKFAREHNLNVGNLRSVLTKARPTHKGWHL